MVLWCNEIVYKIKILTLYSYSLCKQQTAIPEKSKDRLRIIASNGMFSVSYLDKKSLS